VHGTVDTSTVRAGGKPVERAQPDNTAEASEEQRVTEKDNDQTSDEVTVETTSVFRADFLNELDAPAQAGAETAVSGVEGLPVGSALLVVKRGTDHVGRPPSRQRHLPRRRHRQPSARGIPVGIR
jgi:hypothetical protein